MQTGLTFIQGDVMAGDVTAVWRLRMFLLVSVLTIGSVCVCHANAASPPNIVVIFTDDQGYGDLGCYGSTTLKTPRLDQLAREGTRFTNFYAQVVCGPSRSALLTGRYPNRSLGWSMPASEVTVAQVLKAAGYATACFGKWDVSNRAAIQDRMPLAKGFDYYWGTLGANDNGRVVLHKNNELVGETTDMASLTRQYTDKAIEFMKQSREQPFFLYLAHTMAHSVIDASPEFKGKSRGGLYGDTIEELDYHSGRLLDAIEAEGLRDKTLVMFTTDNGPWNNMQNALSKKHDGAVAWGSSGPLREGKGSTYEGGIRVPCITRWPGVIPAERTSDAIFATIDFMPTFASLAGAKVPTDRFLDGVDQSALLRGESNRGAREDYFYFCKNELHGVRKGDWKLLLGDRQQAYDYVKDKGPGITELYNLSLDLGETKNVAEQYPEVVRELKQYATSIPWPDSNPDAAINLTSKLPKLQVDAGGTNLPQGDWLAHGFTVAQRDELRRVFQDGIERRVIPGGSLLLIHRGEVILREAYGVADIESPAEKPFTVTTPCRIASLTKPHTSTLLSMLAEQGLLQLDDPIDRYLPEFQLVQVSGTTAQRVPTLRQCLSHTAGFPGNNSRRESDWQDDSLRCLVDVVARLAKQGLQTQPGTKYEYSGFGYMVAGRVAEVVTGRSFQDLMRRHLIGPLGMETATFLPDEALLPQVAVQYERTETGFRVKSKGPFESVVNPGGSLVSSLDDVARLMLLHRNQGRVGERQLITPAALQEMYVPQPATRTLGYGLGFNILQRRADETTSRIQHTGASGTMAMIDFDQDLIAVILTQVSQNQITAWRNRLVQTILGVVK